MSSSSVGGRGSGGAGSKAKRGGGRGGGHGGVSQTQEQRFSQASQQQQRRRRGNNVGNAGTNRLGYSPSLTFSREGFVKANYVFFLNPRTRSRALRGQDLLEWEDVESLVMFGDGAAMTCPLCLDVPMVARSTPCGHIFCLSCLYRLFVHAADRWERCPICFALIEESCARRVADVKESFKPCLGDVACLALLKRPHTGTVPVLVEDDSPFNRGSSSEAYLSGQLPAAQSGRARLARMCIETPERVALSYVKERGEVEAQF
jgi:hypothetical protein